jgi:SWI/SNF-related matrix-associated actin-dependent regulator of chromatin subfamily D
MAQQQQAAHHQAEQAKRKSRKPTDKSLPDGIDECIIGDVAQRYRDLRDFERQLDATMTRKRLDVADMMNRNTKVPRTLRIWITNTVEDQPWQSADAVGLDSFDFSNNINSSYRVKIEGRLLDVDDTNDDEGDDEPRQVGDAESDDKMDTDGPTKSQQAEPLSAKPGQRSRFSHFFKQLTVDFDRNMGRVGSDPVVEWKKPDKIPASASLPAIADFDVFTFKRNGDETQNVTINLFRDEDELFSVSPELYDIIDEREATRQESVMGVWEYIRALNLQEDEEKRNFRCDELLRKIVGRESGYIPALQEYILPHLGPLDPIKLPYTIRVDEEFHGNPQPTIYDVRVMVDDGLRGQAVAFFQNPELAGVLKDVNLLDEQLITLVQAIHDSKVRHDFLTSLAKDPVNFVRQWLSSQKRDTEVIMGEATRGGGEDATGDEWRRGGRDSVWGSQNARESVAVMLSKPPGHR